MFALHQHWIGATPHAPASGCMWSGDTARGLRVAEQMSAGQVSVNGGALTIETPFGGFKQTGTGGKKGSRLFTSTPR
jgi:acyl-CoA reductase-like NAD-dependent aldehyde dehydrogenase